MRRTIAASLALVISLPALGGTSLAQTDTDPTPEATAPAAADPANETESLVPPADVTLDFEEPKWRRISTDRRPAAREDHTWTVDGKGRYAYLFGGRDGEREFDDLWRYDLRKDTWRRLSPDGRQPAPRFGHSAVWTESHGLIVFAGQRGDDFFADLWAFDPDRGKWRQLPSDGQVPKRRYGSCMVVGPDGRLWISHGFTNSGRFDDTRTYNLNTQRWANLTPDGRKPGERCLHECFTTTAGELVLYGGQDDGNFSLGDLWVMGRDRAWDRLDDPRPQPRRLYGVTEAGDYAYIFGGAGADNSNLDDLWRVDRETLEFKRLRPDGNTPGARFAGTLITDARRGRLLLFGGEGASAKSDLWELVDLADPTQPLEAGDEPATADPDANEGEDAEPASEAAADETEA